jgi:hypothetical protein
MSVLNVFSMRSVLNPVLCRAGRYRERFRVSTASTAIFGERRAPPDDASALLAISRGAHLPQARYPGQGRWIRHHTGTHACIVGVFHFLPDTVVFLVAGVCFRRDRARLVRGDQRLGTLHGVGRVPRCSAKCRSNHSTGSEEWPTRHQR